MYPREAFWQEEEAIKAWSSENQCDLFFLERAVFKCPHQENLVRFGWCNLPEDVGYKAGWHLHVYGLREHYCLRYECRAAYERMLRSEWRAFWAMMSNPRELARVERRKDRFYAGKKVSSPKKRRFKIRRP